MKIHCLSAKNEEDNPVDWWFIYKVSSESISNRTVTGSEYIYYDSVYAKKNSNMGLSPNKITQKSGALFQTLNQLNTTLNSRSGWFFYNDENPDNKNRYKNPNTHALLKPGVVVDSRGHTKGVLAFDFASDSGFWLVHSTPKFPWPEKYVFPDTGLREAQTFLCVTLKDSTTAMKIAAQMYECQQPNVYAASCIPADTVSADDPSALLMQDKVKSGSEQFVSRIPFLSRDGQKFLAIAKNRWWNKDFYNDLVGPTLKESIEVETWEHGKTPSLTDSDKVHKVMPMKSVDLHPLGIPISWSEEFDHGKLAISEPSQKEHWVCVGDINFTLAQRKRGGGTVAFQCEPLWEILNSVLSDNTISKTIQKRHR